VLILSKPADLNSPELLPPLTIETLVNGGNGLARYNGQVVFIPHVAVGDTIVCRVVRKKKNFIEADLVEVVSPSSTRRDPPCPVAGECGGCQWQHLPYQVQTQWKEKLFRDTLTRKCGVSEDRILPIVAAPRELGYRSRVQVKCHGARSGFITGFYRAGSRFVVAVESCPLIDPRLNELMQSCRELIDGTSHAGHIPQIDLAIDDDDKCSTTIHYLGERPDELAACLQSLGNRTDLIIQCGTKNRRKICSGDGILRIQVDAPSLYLNYKAGNFAQINLEQNRTMVASAMDLISWSGSEQVVDLYCGMGNFTLPLARRAGHVVGIEESTESIDMAIRNARHAGLTNVDFICGNAEQNLPELMADKTPDLLVLDPPRCGAYNGIKKIANSATGHIMYISCDPQTLARDLEYLIHHGYALVSSQPIDMFPQTYHCESISYLKKCS